MKVAFALLLCTAALAQTDRGRARQLFEEGVELYRQEKWQAALDKFKASNHAFPWAGLQYNIGQANLKLGRVVEALAAFERFLAEGAGDAPPDRLKQAKKQIALLRARVGRVQIDAPAGTKVKIDGVEKGEAPLDSLVVVAGLHKITFDIPGRGSLEKIAMVRARETVTVEPPPPPPPPPPFYRRWPFWGAVGGVLAAGLVTGGLLATRDEEIPGGDYQEDLRDPNGSDPAYRRWFFWVGIGGMTAGAWATAAVLATREEP